MALDKQRILNELGSVMTQLQTANCGCMGKMFSNPNQGASSMGSPLPTCSGCRRGCCHGHGYSHSHHSAGEQYSMNNQGIGMNTPGTAMNTTGMGISAQGMGMGGQTMNHHGMGMSGQCMKRPCMGHCNPEKLYTDTYNYLNENLMQPVVKEVYHDLNTLTPQNTVVNNAMAGKMGMSINQKNADATGLVSNPGLTHGNTEMNNNGINQMQTSGNFNRNNPNPMANMDSMGGMGPNIVKMIMGEGNPAIAKTGYPEKLTEPMLIDAPQSPHGQIGVTPLTPVSQRMGLPKQQSNMGAINIDQNPGSQVHNYDGSHTVAQSSINSKSPNSAQQMIPTHAAQPILSANQGYGQHTQGIQKFNQMFPGVMQGVGSDLGFDPMAIAIQMNPANQQKAAMDTMQKLMMGDGNRGLNTNAKAPLISHNATPGNQLLQGQQSLVNQHLPQGEQNRYQQVPLTQRLMEAADDASITQPTQLPITAMGQANINQSQIQQQEATQPSQVLQHQQQVYSATGAPIINRQQVQQQQPSEAISGDSANDNNLRMVTGGQIQQPNGLRANVMEPILPVDSSKNLTSPVNKLNKHYGYNMLGQPIELLPAELYRPQIENLPQTLSPQPIPIKRVELTHPTTYSNVKNTVSKTSIVGNKPVGKNPSRSQLQQIYNQYKGSQSFTHQNITPAQAPTYSDGRLNQHYSNITNARARLPIEKVGGDTFANNNEGSNRVEQVKDQIGDIPAPVENKPIGDAPSTKTEMLPKHQKNRNGLQDQVYTSYPTGTAWTFHGQSTAPYSASHRFRHR